MIRGLSLCAGIGGLDLGLRLALGMEYRTVGFVEREAYAAAVLVARMEDAALDLAPIWDDLVTFPGRAWRGAVDLISAGFPCQPWSVAGKRKGAEDERWLWPDIARIVGEVEPGLVFLENVPGLYRHGLALVLSDLAACGFDAEWDCFRARDVGAPHQRERVFVLAYRGDDGRQLIRPAHHDDRRHESRDESHGRDSVLGDACRYGRGLHAAPGKAGRAHGWREPEGPPGERAAPPGVGVGDARGPERGQDAERRRGPREGGDGGGEAAGRPRESGAGLEHAGRGRFGIGGQPEAAGADCRGSRVEHAERPRPQGPGHPGPQWQPFPPGPGDAEGWRDYIAAGGPEPALRRGADGFPSRMDELRAFGNAVVPAQAALAFRVLAGRVMR